MRIKIKVWVPIITLCVLLSGCRTTWTDGQKSQLSQIGVGKVETQELAYHSPDPTRTSAMVAAIPIATGGGLIPALIGSAVDATVKARQKSSYEALYGEFTEDIDLLYAETPEALLKDKMKVFLSEHEFFASRISEEPTSFFNVEILKVGFVRSPTAKNDATDLLYEITGRVQLVLPDGKLLLNLPLSGASTLTAFPEDLASKPELVAVFKEEAVDDFILNLQKFIDARLTGN
ncbi:MAG: hypothetical protein LR015_08420 [Verrucomicrobia bacterium]|nr:hypothetical protein [Verrucomicrobiota bacterium]